MQPAAGAANPGRPPVGQRPPGGLGGPLKKPSSKPKPGAPGPKKPGAPTKKKAGGGCCGFSLKKKDAGPGKPGQQQSKEKSRTSFSSLFKRKAGKAPAGGPAKNVNGLPKPGGNQPLPVGVGGKPGPPGARRPISKQPGQKPPGIGQVPGQARSQQLGMKRDKSLRKLKQGQPVPALGTPTTSKSPAPASGGAIRPKQPNSMTRPKALSPAATHDGKPKALSPPAPKEGLLPISPAILATESPAILPEEQPKKSGSIETTKQRKPLPLSHIRALETSRVFQEVKLCVATMDNGMTERRVLLTSVYPTGNPPKIAPPPDQASDADSIRRGVRVRRRRSVTYTSSSNTCLTGSATITSNNRPNSYNTLDNANSVVRVPNEPSPDMDPLLLSSPIKNLSPSHGVAAAGKATKPPPPTSRERAMSTILQLRGHYQLTHNEIRTLSRNPELKLTTIRAGIALQEAQRNLRNLKILAGTHLLPDLSYFADELSAVILELDRFIDAIHTVSEHADSSPSSNRRPPT
uniref:AAA domain-containing protein n=1 Tax=Panagrellus redivivus TaxID=6233 RepID=A0A7E4UVQ0_PANRE